ncbi:MULTISPECIES: ferrous iron transport protein A [unclassified Arthrobacter]|uniref:putative acetyltransferase n=1 Tax=unclassified Arthrobacter TaxID=235627 RepID=UPI000CE50ED9|nr:MULTISPECIES: ferrous iron transport protein A [unclassified Arthrobacter]
MNTALTRLTQLPLGTRMVVRYRIDGGLSDALGDLTARDSFGCTITTRSGTVTIMYDDVQLAKAVPPPPAPRARRMPL